MLSSGVAPGARRDERRGAERERHVFDGRLRFTPEGKIYHIESGDGSAGRGNGVFTNVAIHYRRRDRSPRSDYSVVWAPLLPPCFVCTFDSTAANLFLRGQATALCWGKEVSFTD